MGKSEHTYPFPHLITEKSKGSRKVKVCIFAFTLRLSFETMGAGERMD